MFYLCLLLSVYCLLLLLNYNRLYMKKLSAIHKAIYLQEKRKEPREETETSSPVVPGDQVYVRVFRGKME